jgi:hypothetical protein
MKSLAIFGAIALVASSASAQSSHPSFKGFSVTRAITAGGNTRYQVFANYSASNIVFLNAFDFGKNQASQPAQYGILNTYHRDNLTADGEVGTWAAGTAVSATDRPEDSWVTSTGLATASGWGTSLDPSFGNGMTLEIPINAGWYDGDPSTPNNVPVGSQGNWDGQIGVGGYQILIMQIVREGNDATNGMGKSRFNLTTGFKIASTTTALFGFGSFTIGTPAPGAVALLALAGLAARRRRG